MCRFLIIKSKDKANHKSLLESFARACKKSIAPDGELQKDGYGIAWLGGGSWQVKKSLAPIWEDQDSLVQVPDTNLAIIHARGAGFNIGRSNVEFIEPFIDGELCFVFNGTIKGVKMRKKVDGHIGSQKLFSLIKSEIKNKGINQILVWLNKFMLKNSEKIEGMNIALIRGEEISVLCQYSMNKNYYTLHYYQDPKNIIISSEAFGDFEWSQFESGETILFH